MSDLLLSRDITIGIPQVLTVLAPESFTAVVVSWSTNSAKVQWGSSSGAISYVVYRDSVAVSPVLKNVSQWIDTNVSPGTYSYYVRATNEADSVNSNTISFVKGVGGIGTIYNILLAIYKALFNTQKLEKVGDTYYLNTYDDDDVTILASCPVKKFNGDDIDDLTGTISQSQRLRSVISATGVDISGSTIYSLLAKVFKKHFNKRKNEVVTPGVTSETVYDNDDVTKISQQDLKTYDGNNIPIQTYSRSPQIREKSTL